MLTSALAIASVALGVSLIGLLCFGARWRRRGPVTAGLYAFMIATFPYLVGEHVWHLPRGLLWGAVGLTFSAIGFVSWIRPDWNPAGQAFLGTLSLTGVLFLTFGVRTALSGNLEWFGVVASLLLSFLEAFAIIFLIVGTHEVLDVVSRVRWRRRARSNPSSYKPFVSVHVAAHNEPPELVIETLTSLRALDYPSYEVIVLDNNTEDEALWRPIESYCEEAGFRFVHLADWPGFKAGALNHGLKICDPRAEVVAVVDADFVVRKDFLARTVGHFADPTMGIVQTAQSFRGHESSSFLRRLALAYRTFDEVSMPSRNERNGIIFAGTMGLLRKEAIVEAGGWAEWCVTEDAELSLRILGLGYQSLYLEQIFGSGVMPLTMGALKRQRFRWCFGGIQLLRAHWRMLITGKGTTAEGRPLSLTHAQRFDYLTAGLQWFQALATVVFSALLLIGVAAQVFGWAIGLRPLVGFLVAVPALLLISGLLKSIWALRARLGVTWRDSFAVIGIWLSMNWAVALACAQGLIRREAAFLRTPKFKEKETLLQALKTTRAETPIGLCLAAASVLAAMESGTDALLLSALSAWGSVVFLSAPVTAFVAARTELPSAVLRRRRRLEERERSPIYRRPVAYALAGVTSAILFALVGGGLTGVPEQGLGDPFELPVRPSERQPEQRGDAEDIASSQDDQDENEQGTRTSESGIEGARPESLQKRGEDAGPERAEPGRARTDASVEDPGADQPPQAAPQATEAPDSRPTEAPASRPTEAPASRPTETPRSQPDEPQPENKPSSRPSPSPRSGQASDRN